MNPEGKARGEGLVNNCFLALCFLGYMLLALKNCMNVCPHPHDCMIVNMSPTRRDCITYTVPCIYLSNHILYQWARNNHYYADIASCSKIMYKYPVKLSYI